MNSNLGEVKGREELSWSWTTKNRKCKTSLLIPLKSRNVWRCYRFTRTNKLSGKVGAWGWEKHQGSGEGILQIMAVGVERLNPGLTGPNSNHDIKYSHINVTVQFTD